MATYIVVVWLKINGENASELRDLHEPNYGRLVRILMDKFKKHNMELNVWLKFKGNATELGGFKYFMLVYIPNNNLVVSVNLFSHVFIF